MSFLPNLAGWALSGGAAGRNEDEDTNENNNNEEPVQQETEEEIRAKRLARLAARFDNKSQDPASDSIVGNETASPAPMEIDSPTPMKELSVDETIDDSQDKHESVASSSGKTNTDAVELDGPLTKKIRAKEPADPIRKLQRKKELLLKKTLKVKLVGSSITDPDAIAIDTGSTSINVENISEIIASRLALPALFTNSSSSELFSYLGACHKRVSEELKDMPAKKNADDAVHDEIVELLQEIKRQVVSYAATSLVAPDLFESAKNGAEQLARCLTQATLDPVGSITVGVAGKNSSFYASLCDELMSQDMEVFESVISDIVKLLREELSKSENVLENTGSSGLVQVAALTALCSCKKAAVVVANTPGFLLPKEGSAQAAERVRAPVPPPPAGATPQQLQIYRMMSAMAHGRQSYLKRSGPALEKDTLLGLVLRLGTPMDSSAVTSQFQNVARTSRNEVQKRTDTLRRQLRVYQDTVHGFMRSLITAGEEARKPVSTEERTIALNDCNTTTPALTCEYFLFLLIGFTMVCGRSSCQYWGDSYAS